ncbi:hypothetical protein ABK905_10770 [Acerihabitans sp. KWT182]|uniref:Sigma-54 factor interaction domain-containing protein n=1 Tax=Acerihabitans sp. KWT182 TaxID=3157919 RepID=A0AAU7QE56_9GAMM
MLVNYSWPGNIRELENIIEYLYICSEENFITDDILLPLLRQNQNLAYATRNHDDLNRFCAEQLEANALLPDILSRVEKAVLSLAVEKYKTTYHIATALGVSQPTIARKLQSLGMGRRRSSLDTEKICYQE